VLEGADLSQEIREEWLPEVISSTAREYTASELQDEWDLDGLVTAMEALYGTGVTSEELRGLDAPAIVEEFLDDASDAYAERESEIEGMQEGLMRDLERFVVLQVVDTRWREHLENMDYMREGIHLRGMAQKDPLVECRNEGAMMFQELNLAIREEVVTHLFHLQVEPADAAALEQPSDGRTNGNLSYEHQSMAGADAIAAAGGGAVPAVATAAVGGGGSVSTPVAPRPVVKSEHESLGRNDPCWCGSGKKFKRCHGA
jgi:preprotein translocase subunit SecA